MDTSLSVMGIIILILIILSAFASATEMAISSINRIRIKMNAEDGDIKAKKILILLNNYEFTITTIVVFNNIVNILLSTISTLFFTNLISDENLAVFCSTFIMTILIVLFGEIIPKIYGKELNEKHLYQYINVLFFLRKILYIFTLVFIKISKFIQDKFFPKIQEENAVEEEILTMIEEGVEEGNIEEEQEELIRNAIEFEEIKVEEIYQPKSKVVALSVDEDPKNIFKIMKKERYSRIPVYEKTSDNIIGILYERDFLNAFINEPNLNIRDLLREAYFIPETMQISKLLLKLQRDHVHMAIVIDESGIFQGIITVEDIIEEIVGEIWDEHDDIEKDILKISENNYELIGQLSINDFNEEFGNYQELESTENTIAGYIIQQMQEIPKEDSFYENDIFKFTVIKMDNNRIDKILLEIKELND